MLLEIVQFLQKEYIISLQEAVLLEVFIKTGKPQQSPSSTLSYYQDKEGKHIRIKYTEKIGKEWYQHLPKFDSDSYVSDKAEVNIYFAELSPRNVLNYKKSLKIQPEKSTDKDFISEIITSFHSYIEDEKLRVKESAYVVQQNKEDKKKFIPILVDNIPPILKALIKITYPFISNDWRYVLSGIDFIDAVLKPDYKSYIIKKYGEGYYFDGCESWDPILYFELINRCKSIENFQLLRDKYLSIRDFSTYRDCAFPDTEHLLIDYFNYEFYQFGHQYRQQMAIAYVEYVDELDFSINDFQAVKQQLESQEVLMKMYAASRWKKTATDKQYDTINHYQIRYEDPALVASNSFFHFEIINSLDKLHQLEERLFISLQQYNIPSYTTDCVLYHLRLKKYYYNFGYAVVLKKEESGNYKIEALYGYKYKTAPEFVWGYVQSQLSCLNSNL